MSGSISVNLIVWSLEKECFTEFMRFKGSKYHHLILPAVYRAQVLQLLHDEQGHQRTEHTMALVSERFFWSMMCQDVNNWVKTCNRCKKAKGPYNDPNVKEGSLIANHLLEILCFNFTIPNHSKDGKENVLVMTATFSNFTVAVITHNQQAKTVAKAMIDRWFYTYGIPSRIHNNKGKSFNNNIIHYLCTIYEVKQSPTTLYNLQGSPKCERFNQTFHNPLKMLLKSQKPNWPAH